MNAIEQADRAARAGDTAAALALLNRAGDAGDVDALAQLANHYLVGALVPRDLPRARGYLRRAIAIGHVDAALMEIAFTANGSGGAADWPAALALLRQAAASDPVAAQQLAMLDAMRLAPDGRPRAKPASKRLSASPDVQLFPGLFSPAECRHIAEVAAPMLAPSQIVDPASGALRPHPVRTSDGAVIGPAQENLVVRALNARIAMASGTHVDQGESLSVLRYRPGQQYRPHHDALPGETNQRGWTMLVYLNQGYRGGETAFMANGLKVVGRGGDGLLFRNLDDDGRPDPRARHAGMPVLAGDKWLCTRWIRQERFDPWSARHD